MQFLKNVFKGMAIGAGAIIPGVSSGVICVILGIYERLLESVLGIFKDFKRNIKFLFPITLGGIIGIILFSNLLKNMFNLYPLEVNYTCIGLIMGSIPSLVKNVESKQKFKLTNFIYLLIALIIGFGMVILECYLKQDIVKDSFSSTYLVLAGVCMSAGVIIPGVSSTVILMLLGVYSNYLNSIANVYLPTLIPIILGLIIGSIVCMKIIKYLLNNYYVQTFYSIIGFSIGSVFVLYPGFSLDLHGVCSIICLFAGIVLTKALK